jgi:hypothetical protein
MPFQRARRFGVSTSARRCSLACTVLPNFKPRRSSSVHSVLTDAVLGSSRPEVRERDVRLRCHQRLQACLQAGQQPRAKLRLLPRRERFRVAVRLRQAVAPRSTDAEPRRHRVRVTARWPVEHVDRASDVVERLRGR